MADIRNIKSGKPGGEPPGESRRLAAIVAGDIAGYSRLMQIDEEGTHGRVKRIERDLIEPSIVGHHGKLVKTTGDGFLAIFDSPVEAVRCAIVIQQNMVGRNAALPSDCRPGWDSILDIKRSAASPLPCCSSHRGDSGRARCTHAKTAKPRTGNDAT